MLSEIGHRLDENIAPAVPAWSSKRQALRWLIPLRWVAVVAIGLAIVAATLLTDRIPSQSAEILWGLDGVLAAVTLALTIQTWRQGLSFRLLASQVAVDVAVLAAAIHLVGGIGNPFLGLFVVQTAIAALMLPRTAAIASAFGVAAVVGLLTALEVTGVLVPGCLYDAAGICRESDPLIVASWGTATALSALAGGLLIERLVSAHDDHAARVERVSDELRQRAAALMASQSEVVRERQKLEQVVACMADAVVVAAPDGRIVLRNQASRALWPDRPEGADDLRVCHSESRWNDLLRALENPKDGAHHPLLHVGDRVYDANWAAVRTPAGDAIGAVMVARDVTARREEERSRMDKERLATIGRLAAGLAHELNNPLSAIALFSQHALKSLEPGSPLAEHLQTVRSNAASCSRIVQDLLSYARQRPPERRRFALRDLVGDTIRTILPHCRHRGVEIVESFETDDEATLFGDADQLRQVMVNLGMNGIDAMPAGGTLTLSVRGAENHVELAVSDTGAGIDPADAERIFTPFYTTKAEGTGLGLAVVRDIVTAHDGQIEVASPPGGGTTFKMVLPSASEPQKEVA